MTTDNLTQVDNQAQPEAAPAPVSTSEATTATVTTPSGWKSTLSTDLRNSPLLQKFEDTPEGLNKALESHANLEKLLGHEKVPIPKDVNDVEGWNRFSKAMGIPDKAEGYGLPDPQIPESMKDLTLDKNKFAEVMHAHKVHPSAVKGIWNTYQQLSMEAYKTAMQKHEQQLTETVNRLKGEWGDAYDTNVELGQMTINKFSDDSEMNEWLTANLLKHPYGVKFAAKIGDQFAENKIGEFQMKRFSLAPDQAKEEWQKITRDPQHPYNNEKATPREREEAINYVNSLIAAANRG